MFGVIGVLESGMLGEEFCCLQARKFVETNHHVSRCFPNILRSEEREKRDRYHAV